VLRSFVLRLTRTEGAVNDMLDIATELKETSAALRTTASRLEAAVSEQGDTLANALEGIRDESKRRIGLGRQVMEHEHRLGRLEFMKATNGAAG